jgi:hypothetical protein
VNIEQIDGYLDLWDNNKLEKLWGRLNTLSQPELAFACAWITVMIRDMGEVRLSQWVVWLETKVNAQNR